MKEVCVWIPWPMLTLHNVVEINKIDSLDFPTRGCLPENNEGFQTIIKDDEMKKGNWGQRAKAS